MLSCRAPSSATTCAGTTPNGAALNYDLEGRLWFWQTSPNNWSTYAGYLYDGEGQRVGQQANANGDAALYLVALVPTLLRVHEVGKNMDRWYLVDHGLIASIGLFLIGRVVYLVSKGFWAVRRLASPLGQLLLSPLILQASLGSVLLLRSMLDIFNFLGIAVPLRNVLDWVIFACLFVGPGSILLIAIYHRLRSGHGR